MARWEYFHKPVFTAAYYLDPRFVSHELNFDDAAETNKVFEQIATEEHCLGDIMIDYGKLRTAIAAKSYGMTLKCAFSQHATEQSGWQWAQTFLYPFPHLRWAATRLLALRASASDCERSCSTQGWIHSKNRNRMQPLLVERLLRAHTNMKLEDELEDWEG